MKVKKLKFCCFCIQAVLPVEGLTDSTAGFAQSQSQQDEETGV